MCYAASCNPRCGSCRPKRIVEAVCPTCALTSEMTREAYLNLFGLPHVKSIMEEKMLERCPIANPACPNCGTNLTDAFSRAVTPRECSSSRVLCGFPCGRATEPYREGSLPCPTMVPLANLD